MSELINVWACGGGTQSAAIAGLICEGKLPKPNHALMVDTEREKATTWRYVNGVLRPNLERCGVDLVVIPKSRYATVDLYSLKSRNLLIPAYTANGDGKLSTFCSGEWKTRVMQRYLRREHGISGSDYIEWIGFSTNELRRVTSGRRRYPLIYDHPMSRDGCRAYVASLGWPDPPRGGSACWMCPQQHDSQWIDLRDNEPEDFRRAVAFDVEIRLQDPNVFVHRSGKPLGEIADSLGESDQIQLFGCESGMCYT